jgi:thioredoxin 2
MSVGVIACPACETKNRVAATATGVPHCPKCGAALPWLVDADDSNFAAVVGAASLPVLLDLWAPWCPPCRMIAPAVAASAARFAGRLKVAKLNVDVAPQTARAFNVQGIPTLLILRGGTEVERQVGVLIGDALPQWIERSIARANV